MFLPYFNRTSADTQIAATTTITNETTNTIISATRANYIANKATTTTTTKTTATITALARGNSFIRATKGRGLTDPLLT